MARKSQHSAQNNLSNRIKQTIFSILIEAKLILAEFFHSFFWVKEVLFPQTKVSKSTKSMVVQIPSSVYFEIIANCLRSMGKNAHRTYSQGKEFSGGLIGYKEKEGRKTIFKIPYLLDSSLAIVSESVGHVTTDGDFQQAALDYYNEHGYSYFGDYHLHPEMIWSVLSPQDFHQVRMLLDEPDNGIDEMIMLLVNIDLRNTTSRQDTLAEVEFPKDEDDALVSELNQLVYTSIDFRKYIKGKPFGQNFPLSVNSIFQVRAFYMHKKDMFFKRLQLEVVPRLDDAKINNWKDFLKPFSYADDKGYWHESEEGKKRIKHEIELLKGYGTNVKVMMTDRLGSKTLTFVLENPKLWLSKKVVFYLPKDYPRYSPTWLVTDGDKYYRQGVIKPWYKTSFLVHAVAFLESNFHSATHHMTIKEKAFLEVAENARKAELAKQRALWQPPLKPGEGKPGEGRTGVGKTGVGS